MRLKCMLAINILFMIVSQSVFASVNDSRYRDEGSRGRTLTRVKRFESDDETNKNRRDSMDLSLKERNLLKKVQEKKKEDDSNLNLATDDVQEDENQSSWRSVASNKKLSPIAEEESLELFSYKSQVGQSDIVNYDPSLDVTSPTTSLKVHAPDDDSSSISSDESSDDGL